MILASPPTSPTPQTSRVPLWLLVLVTLGGTLAMHMFVPALPSAAHHLGTSAAQMQMTVTLYVIGLGVGQLIYGPLSDSLGRRPMLLTGLTVYILASLVAFFAPNVHTLVGARLVQALGGCAGLALGRAIARDTATAESAVRSLALLNLMVLMGPGFSPFIGTVIEHALGWRGIFLALAALGAITWIGVWFRLPETHPPSGRFNGRQLARDYLSLLRNPRFFLVTLGGGSATMCIYAFVAASPFIFMQQLHTSQYHMALYVGVILTGMGLGNIITSQLATRIRMRRVMMAGNALALLAAAGLCALALTGQARVLSVLLLMSVFNFGLGLMSPTALTQAMNADPRLVGAAAGVYGASQMALGALATVLATLGSDPLQTTSIILLGGNVIGLMCFLAHRALTTRSQPQA